MKTRSFFTILASLLFSALILSACGEKTGETAFETQKAYENILIFDIDADELDEDEFDKIKSVMENRLQVNNIKDYQFEGSAGEKRIRVKYNSSATADKSQDEKKRLNEELSVRRNVTFRPGEDAEEISMDENGNTIKKIPANETGQTVLMDGSCIESAQAHYGSMSNGSMPEGYVEIIMTEEGRKRFEDITREYRDKVVSIWLDDEMISAPYVNAVISDGKAVISGNLTSESAKELAEKINSGSLPYSLTPVEY